MELALGILIGVAIGGALIWLSQRPHLTTLQDQARCAATGLTQAQGEGRALTERLGQPDAELARLQEALSQEKRGYEEKLALLRQAEDELKQVFKALSADALRESNESFLHLATTSLREVQTQAVADLDARKTGVEHLVGPLTEKLEALDHNLHDLERAREGAYQGLTEQMRGVAQTQERLERETTRLAGALSSTRVQGQWGELQLRRVVELAGMVEYCDFQEQSTVQGPEGERLRPDLVVRLPGGQSVVVDAKTPLEAYLRAAASDNDGEHDEHLRESSRQVREHMRALSAKAYWEQFPQAPELVVMFLPEPIYLTALRLDPTLLEDATQQRVFLASPATLIVLLKAIAYGWRQEKITENARQISALGRDLHQRIAKLAEHFARVGHELGQAVDAYNATVGSLEGRVLVQARRLSELGAASSEEMPEIAPVDHAPRALQAPELIGGPVSSKADVTRDIGNDGDSVLGGVNA